MIYQNPKALYALAAIAIPIIIHFINLRRYQKIYFSNTQFLKKIKQEQQKNSQLRNIIVLICRISAIIFLVLAFSKPYLPSEKDKTKKNNVILYIDNSFSMNAKSKTGRLLDIAKQKAREIISIYNEINNFYIVTNDLHALSTQAYNINEINKIINNIENSSSTKNISYITNYINEYIEENADIYIISDLQKNIFDLNKINITEKANYYFIPLQAQKSKNISIDSLWLTSPLYTTNNLIELTASIHNHSKNDIENIPVTVKLNNKQKSQQLISIPASSTKNIPFNFYTENNKINAGVVILEDSPINFDNKRYFSFQLAHKTNILSIEENINKNNQLAILFNNDSTLYKFSHMDIHQMKYENINKQNFIIINSIKEPKEDFQNKITEFIRNGGTATIIPPTKGINFKLYNTWFKNMKIDSYSEIDTNNYKISDINTQHNLFNNVFKDDNNKHKNMPNILQHYNLINTNQNIKRNIYKLENKSEYVNEYIIGKGKLYLFTSSLNESSSLFSRHALFVPTFINMATQSIQASNIYYTIGEEKMIIIPEYSTRSPILHLHSEKIDIIPRITIHSGIKKITYNQIKIANNYLLKDNNGKIIQPISFNYNKNESNINYFNPTALKEWITNNNHKNCNILTQNNIKQKISKANLGTEYWKFFLILSLLALLLEILFIKLFKS